MRSKISIAEEQEQEALHAVTPASVFSNPCCIHLPGPNGKPTLARQQHSGSVRPQDLHHWGVQNLTEQVPEQYDGSLKTDLLEYGDDKEISREPFQP